LVHNERILRDLQFGPGAGAFYRAADHHQMATFSSRGPSPDGRANVDAIANGFANFVMGPTGGINLVSGTSFSAPTIAGAAATLRQAFPGASALQIRNALVETANPDFLGDNPGPIDQGHGFIDLVAAYNALAAGEVSNTLPSGPASNSVRGNIASVGLQTVQLGNSGYSTRLEGLVPGEVAHFFIDIDDRVDALNVSFSNITPELPTEEQNQFFVGGDGLFVVVQDSITSTDVTLAGGFFGEDTTLVAANPGTGLLRVAVMGDWTNAGSISADMYIEAVSTKRPRITERDRVVEGDFRDYVVNVPEGAEQANFELHWQQDWGRFPTDDLDLIVVDPEGGLVIEFTEDGTPFLPGATFSAPERVVINDPMPGEYMIFVDGFTVWGERGNRAQFALYAFDENGKQFSDQKVEVVAAPAANKGKKK
ncbi:MAG TPA: S8 family serine peptidase, partial [Gammaproteobacteria bacterium]|nr:S8 family serine peptidase [Gammaproteobacteria bacterium]